MTFDLPGRRPGHVVLIVDDLPQNLAVLHDALDESGYTVIVANDGAAALVRAREVHPDIILLDALMPGMDGFEVCRRLKADVATRSIPVVFMTGLTETEHVLAAFAAGGTDYVTKPLRQNEVLARISAHLQTARMMNQARSALDAFGNAAIALSPHSGKIVWQTPLARQLLQQYFDIEGENGTPASVSAWLAGVAAAVQAGLAVEPLRVEQGVASLLLTAADVSGSEQWMVVLREEAAPVQAQSLAQLFKLTQREAEVLDWVIKGKTNRDIGEILGTSPRTVNKHLEHVFVKLGVETRTAAASVALNKVRAAS